MKLETIEDKPLAARFLPDKLPHVVFVSPRGVQVVKYIGDSGVESLVKAIQEADGKARAADEELGNLEKAAKDDPTSHAARKALADFWQSHGNVHEANPVWRAIASDTTIGTPEKERPNAWFQVFTNLMKLQRNDDAATEADLIAKAHGRSLVSAKAHFLRGKALELEKRYAEAAAATKDAAELWEELGQQKIAGEARARVEALEKLEKERDPAKPKKPGETPKPAEPPATTKPTGG